MAGTFYQIYMHIVFAVKGRKSLIKTHWEEELYRYITGIITNKDQKLLAINGMPDHIHILIGMRPSCCLSDLVRELKKSSNEFINKNRYSYNKFEWQSGYGVFSHGHHNLDNIFKYIRNQKEHHKKVSFREEYTQLLKEFEIEFKDEYLFEWVED